MDSSQLLLRLKCSTLLDARRDAAVELKGHVVSNSYSLSSEYISELLALASDGSKQEGIIEAAVSSIVDVYNHVTIPLPSGNSLTSSIKRLNIEKSNSQAKQHFQCLFASQVLVHVLNVLLSPASSLERKKYGIALSSLLLDVNTTKMLSLIVDNSDLFIVTLSSFLTDKLDFLRLMTCDLLVKMTGCKDSQSIHVRKLLFFCDILDKIEQFYKQSGWLDSGELGSKAVDLLSNLIIDSHNRQLILECGYLSKLLPLLPDPHLESGSKIAQKVVQKLIIPLTLEDPTKFLTNDRKPFIQLLGYGLFPKIETATRQSALIALSNLIGTNNTFRLVSDAIFNLPDHDDYLDCNQATGLQLLTVHILKSGDRDVLIASFELFSKILSLYESADDSIKMIDQNYSFFDRLFQSKLTCRHYILLFLLSNSRLFSQKIDLNSVFTNQKIIQGDHLYFQLPILFKFLPQIIQLKSGSLDLVSELFEIFSNSRCLILKGLISCILVQLCQLDSEIHGLFTQLNDQINFNYFAKLISYLLRAINDLKPELTSNPDSFLFWKLDWVFLTDYFDQSHSLIDDLAVPLSSYSDVSSKIVEVEQQLKIERLLVNDLQEQIEALTEGQEPQETSIKSPFNSDCNKLEALTMEVEQLYEALDKKEDYIDELVGLLENNNVTVPEFED
ncbi:hypothetical protein P9112_014567 [Eukaryota sp. TZLM1-RC]